MSRALKVLDPNLPSTSSNTLANPNFPKEGAPRNKMREWTFPRSASPSISNSHLGKPSNVPSNAPPATNNHSSAANSAANCDNSHARTTSTSVRNTIHASPTANSNHAEHSSPSGNFQHAPLPDIRHRSNASLAYPQIPASASSRLLTSNSSLTSAAASTTSFSFHRPADLIKMVYLNVRRRSITDILYLFVFGATLILFASALMGYGAAANIPNTALDADPTPRANSAPIQVEIPAGFRPKQDFVPADVHQPAGDNSHDHGEDLFKASPHDPALDDENVHHVVGHEGEEALFHRPLHENELHAPNDHVHESSVQDADGDVNAPEAAPEWIRAEIDGSDTAAPSDSELEPEEEIDALKAEEAEAYEQDAQQHQHEGGHAAVHDVIEDDDDDDVTVVSAEEEVELELEMERLEAEEREKSLKAQINALRHAQQQGDQLRRARDAQEFAARKAGREEIGRQRENLIQANNRKRAEPGFKKQRIPSRKR